MEEHKESKDELKGNDVTILYYSSINSKCNGKCWSENDTDIGRVHRLINLQLIRD